MEDTTCPVIIIGAGPVGLYTALVVAQAGFSVKVYEKEAHFVQSPRAIAYFPAVLDEFRKTGIIDDIVSAGYKNNDGVDWRDAHQNILAQLTPPPWDASFTVQLGQPEVCRIIYDNLLKTGNATVHFNQTFIGAEQQEGVVIVQLRSKNNEITKHRAQYVIGADGGHSAVRKSLGLSLEGYTWTDFEITAANIRYDLGAFNWKSANFIMDPECWSVVAKISKDNLWRVGTGIPVSQSSNPAEMSLERKKQILIQQLRKFLPGNTDDIIFESIQSYVVHQRCVPSFKQGNILLAGDAAHLNNPIGGLGLTTGFLDAAHLGQALTAVLKDGANDSVLESYAEIRREKFLEVTNPNSEANLRRLCSTKPEHETERKTFLRRMSDMADISIKLQLGKIDYAISSTSSGGVHGMEK